MESMKILFAGTPAFATTIFERIYHENIFTIVGLLCQPDKPFGRKGELKPPHTKEYFKTLDVKILQPEKIDENVVKTIESLAPDVILVVAYGKILPTRFLNIARCINIHASLLPQWRGASPLQQMLINQPAYFGITAMNISPKLDSGEILGYSYVPNTHQNFPTLSLELAQSGGKLALKVLKNLSSLQAIKQINADSTYCQKIKKNDGCVTFDNAREIYHKYLAYCVWPHIFIYSSLGYTLKLSRISLCDVSSSNTQGEILAIESDSIIIGCSKGSLRIQNLQQEGKKTLGAVEYLCGKRLKVGEILC